MNRGLQTIFVLLAVLILPLIGSAQDEADEMLRIRSNGRTRIEIRNGDQIAVYTGGVQFDYLDYRLTADELHYTEVDSLVEAMGNVSLTQLGSRLDSDRIEFHLDTNTLISPGEISGNLADEGLGFLAASAVIELSAKPGDKDATYLISLRDQVFVSSTQGYSFTTSHVSMDTGTGLLNVPQSFSLRLPSGKAGASGPVGMPMAGGDLLLTGSSMTGQLDSDLQIQSLHALAPEIRGEQLQFNAGSIKAGFMDNGHDGIMIDILATGSPVRGAFRQPGEDLTFSADSIAGTIDPGYGSKFLLDGGINLSSDLALLVSDTVNIVQDSQGLRIVFPEGLEAGMALDVITGNEGMDISGLLHK